MYPTEEPPQHKVANKLLAVAMALIVACVAVVLLWLNQPTNVLTINNAPFPVRSVADRVQDNGVIIMHVDYCKNIDAKGVLRMSFVSERSEVLLPTAKETSQKGCHKTDLPVLVPSNLPPGIYYVKFHVTYAINPLKQNAAVDFNSQKFEVVK